MKKIAMVCACLLLVFCSAAAGEGVPEDVLHDAIMTLTWEDTQGECWVEGRVVLGTEETDATAVVYAQVSCQNYGFLAGIFTDTGGGFVYPVTLIFDKGAGGYALREIKRPEDGERYWPSLEAMMPKACLDRLVENDTENRAEIKRQMYAQAQTYLDSIGRTERVGDWRDLNLQLPGLLVTASNQTTAFSPPYPMWVTQNEQVEYGERYVYKCAWEPDGASGDSQTYTTPGGGTLLCDGTTGTQTLTKTRQADGAVLETITARAELYDLYVTYADEYGTKEYHFTFDGLTYHQPTITESGACRVSYPGFDARCGELPE